MTEPTNETPDLDPLTRDALAWVLRLRSGEATTADLEALQRWRDQSSDHDAAFKQAATLWKDLRTAADRVKERDKGTVEAIRPLRPVPWRPSRRAVFGGAIAASAAAYAVIHPPLKLWPSLSEFAADYRTGKGERRDLALVEGVAIQLNTQTSITMLKSGQDDPQIELISGEAAIVAKRSPGRPLTVLASGGRMVSANATFNTRCIAGIVSVTCVEGDIEVEHDRRVAQLCKGQRVDYSAAAGLGLPLAIDPVQATAWQKGLLIFRDRPLVEVVDEVNRYRSGRIVVTNNDLGRRMVNGTFHLDRLDDFVGQVRQLFGASVRSLPGGVVLLS